MTTNPTPTSQLITEAAQAICRELPSQLLVRVMEEQLQNTFRSLMNSYSTGPTLEKLVHKAVDDRISELLRTTYKTQVDQLADSLAVEALGVARRDLRITKGR